MSDLTQGDPMTRVVVSSREARDALWNWFSHDEWENSDLAAMPDEAYEKVDDGIRSAFAGFCIILGCVNNGYGECIYCNAICGGLDDG